MSGSGTSRSSSVIVAVVIVALFVAGFSFPAVHAATASTTSQTDTLICSPTQQTLGKNVTCTSTVVVETGNAPTITFFNNSVNGGFLMLAPVSCNGADVNPTEISCAVSLMCQGPADTVTVVATYGGFFTATTNIVCTAAGASSVTTATTSTSTTSPVPEFPQGALSALLCAALIVAVAVSSRRCPAIADR